MTEQAWPGALIRFVSDLDSGAQARLRRGADPVMLLMVPGLAALLRDVEGSRLEDDLLTAQIAAILGRNGAQHPAKALANAKFNPKRMGRLLTADPEVLPERLIVVTRFLVAKNESAAVAPFHWLMAEVRRGNRNSTRAEWARRFGEAVLGSEREKA